MPLNADPHFYDSFGGFDTSTLYNNGAFAASALNSGTGGKTIADAVAAINAADHVAATNSAIALIRKVALDNGVSPVTSLVTFIHQLVALNHDTSLVQRVQSAFFSLITAGTVTAANTASQATAAAIAIAQAGTQANAVAAGSELANILSQVRIGVGGDGQDSYPSAIAQIQAAIGGALSSDHAIDMLAGMPLGSAAAGSYSQAALQTLIGADTAKASRAITDLATAFAASPHNGAWTYIGQVAGWVGFSTTQTNAVVTGLIGSSLTAAQAVVLLSQLAGGAQSIATLISGHTISASDAFTALAAYAASVPGTSESSAASSALIAVAALSSGDFAVQMAAASAFASLVGVTTDANSAINMIANNAQLTPQASISMLAAIGALGNVLTPSNNKYSLQLIGDAIRIDMGNGLAATDAVTALAAGFNSLGLSTDEQVRILAGVGGVSVFNVSTGFGGDPDLKAASAAQIYSLVQANSGHLTAQQLAADFALAMSGASVGWPQIVDVLVRVAGSDTTVAGLVGGALADLIGLSPFASPSAVSTVITAIHKNSVFPTQILTGAQTTGILIGMAGTGGIATQVAAGGELGALVQGSAYGAISAAAITAAITAGTLTKSQATLFLAGAAGNANTILVKGVFQNAYTDLLASLVSSDSAVTAVADIHGAVVGSALTADKALFFLAALGANSTGATQTAAANEILALVTTPNLLDPAHAVGVLAGAAGTVGTLTTSFLIGETVGSSTYNAKVGYQNIFQGAIGAQIALLTTTPQAGLSAQAAVDAIHAAITANKLSGADAVRVLMGAAAMDAAIEPLAQAEIINLIGANTISAAAVVAVLQAMLPGASSAIQTVVNNELGLLIVDFNTLDTTAGTGNSAQILAAAIAIDTLLNGSSTDQTNGQTVLNHLSGRITGATLLSANAIELLLDLAGRSANGLTSALATLQTLSTPIGQGFGIIRYDTVISTTGTMLAAGKLSSSAALAVLGSFSIYNNSTFPFTQTALAAAIGTGATHITIGQIHAAVQAGTFPAADAIGALGKFANANGGSLQTQAIAEINALAIDPTTRGLAVQALANIITSTDPTIRSAGYAGLNAFVASNTTFAAQAFALVAPRANSGDAASNADAMAELVTLATTYGNGANVTGPFASLISASIAQQNGNIVGETPWLQVLVNLLGVPNVEPEVLNYLVNRVNTDQLNGQPFTATTVIRDIAVTYGDDTSRAHTTALELQALLNYVTAADMVAALTGASFVEQTNVLTALLDLYGQAVPSAFTLRLAELHPTPSTIGPLYQAGSLTPGQAMALLAPILQSDGVAAFLAAIVTVSPYIQPGVIASGLVDATETGSISPTIGLEALIAIGAGSAPALQRAAEAGLASAIVQQKAIAGNLSANIAYALGQGAATGAQAVTFLADVYLARLQTVVAQSLLQPSDTQATAALKATLVAQLATLITNYSGSGASLRAVAKAAKDNFANVNEIAGVSDLIVALSPMFGDASFVTAQIAAAVPTISAYDAVSLLAGVAGQLGGNYLAATGVTIASLVASGAITAANAGFNLYSAVQTGVLSTAQANAIGIGAAGVNPFLGAALIANIANFDSTAMSTVVRDAVVANTLLTLQGLDVAAGFAKLDYPNASAATVAALVAAGKTTTHAAIIEFGTLIGATASTISSDQFMSILQALANATDLAGRTAIGADLATVIGGGALTAQQAATAFNTAVVNHVINFGPALDVLIGASTGSIAGGIGHGFASAIVSDADTAAAMTSIKTSISAGTLTLTQATKLLVGIAGGGTQRLKATVGLTAAEIAHDGPGSQLAAFVSEVSAGNLTAADAAFVLTIFYDRMASFKLVDTQNGASSQIIANDNFSLGSAVFQISSLIGSGSITTAAALAQVEAAWTSQQANAPQPTVDQIVALMFAIPAVNEFSGAASVVVGEKFASLIASGFSSSNFGSYVVSQAGTIAATPAIDVLAAMAQASGTPGSLLNEIYAKLITLGTPTFVATTIGNLISPTALTHVAGLSVLTQLAVHGNAAVKNAVLAEFTLLLNAGTVTANEVNTALSDPQLPGADALVLLVNAANTTNILPQNTYFSAIQTKVAALATSLGDHDAVQAIIAALDASSLSGGQIVDTLAKFLPVNGNTDSLIGNEIGKLELAGRISEADAATIVGRVLVTLSPNSQAAMARVLAFAGFFVGETAAQVAAGTGSATLPADQVATILANLAAIDVASFNQPSLNAIYPYLGVAAGAKIVGLVSPQFTIAQALASITGATGIDANNRALVLFGVASVGSASQQVEAGKALATVYQSGGSFDLLANSGELLTLLTPDRATVLLAGMAAGGTAATKTYAGSLFAALMQTNGNQLSIAQVKAAIDGSALPATDAANVLAVIGAGLAANGANSDAIRAGLDTELNLLVSSGRLSVGNAVNALVAQAGAGSVALQAATGRLIASLQNAGLATSTTLIGLVDGAVGTTLTAAQAVAIYTGAAIVNTGSFAPALGGKIGAMIEAGQISVANAMAAIAAADTAYGVSAGAGEAALLVAAAGHVATGLQTAAGQAIGALLTRGAIAVAATIASIDTAIGVSNGVSASQAGAILIGVASSSPFQAQVAIGVEFAALIAANKLTSTAVIQSVDQAMSSGILTATPAFAVFVAMAATGSTLAASVATEIAGLVSGARMTADEALAVLFAAAGSQDFNFTSAQTDKAIAGIASALLGQSLTNASQVATDLIAAESVSHTISPNHALGVLVALAAGGPAAATQAYGTALPALLANGVTSASLTAAVAAPSISADNAVLFLASAVGAASSGQASSVELASGAALAAILNAGGLAAAQIVTDLRSAVTSGALSADREVALIAGLANGISLSGKVATLAGESVRLVSSSTLTAASVFADILSVAPAGTIPQSLVSLIAGMAATPDAALQAAVGNEIVSLINAGRVTMADALADVTGLIGDGLTVDQSASLLVMLGAGGGPAFQVLVGQQLVTSGANVSAVLTAQLTSHSINGAQAVATLVGVSTQGYPAQPVPNFGGAARSVAQAIYDGQIDLSAAQSVYNATNRLLSTASENGQLVRGTLFKQTYLSLQAQVTAGTLTAAAARTSLGQTVNGSQGFTDAQSAFLNAMGNFASNPVALQIVQNLGVSYFGTDIERSFADVVQANSVRALWIVNTTGVTASGVNAASILSSLLASGLITSSDVANGSASTGTSVDSHRLIYWLTSLAGTPNLRDGAARALAAMVSAGTVSDAQVLADIAKLAANSPGVNSPVTTISAATQMQTLIGLAVYGDAPMSAGAPASIAALIVGSEASARRESAFALIDGYANTGSFSYANAVKLITNIVASGPAAEAAAAGAIAATHIKTYVTGSHMTAADAVTATLQSAGTSAAGAVAAGEIVANLVGTAQAFATVSGALTAHTMTAATAVGALYGIDVVIPVELAAAQAALQPAITQRLAVLNGNSPNVTWILQRPNGELYSSDATLDQILQQRNAFGATAAATQTAIDAKWVALVAANEIPAADLISILNTARGGIPFDLLEQLSHNASPATLAAVADGFVTYGRQQGLLIGPSSDPFFTGALARAGLDFEKLINGTITVAAAITDLQQFAASHHASFDAGLVLLKSLLQTDFDNATNSGSFTTQQLLDKQAQVSSVTNLVKLRVAAGMFGADLAQRVAEGETPDNQFAGTTTPADPTAISYAAARTLLASMVGSYGGVGSTISSIANFSLDVSILELNRTNNYFNGGIVGGGVGAIGALDYLQRGLVQYVVYNNAVYQGLTEAERGNVLVTKSNGYAIDQALLALIGQLSSSDAPTAASNRTEAIKSLGARVLNGPAETDLVNQVANGSLTADQAIAALNALLAPVIAGVPTGSATLARQTAMGWLSIKSAQYIEGNYKIVTDAQGRKSVQSFSDNVDVLYQTLTGSPLYSDDVLAGLGGILRNGSTSISAADRATDMKVVQSILGVVADASAAAYAGGRTLTTDAEIKAASDHIMADTADKFHSFKDGFLSLNSYFGLPGIATIVDDPSSLKGYVDLGTQMGAGGLPFTFGVNTGLPDLTGATYDELLGEGVGGNLAVVGTAAKVVLFVLGYNAVWNALGPIAPTIKGIANVTAATTDLLGNIVTGVVTAGKDAYWDAGKNVGKTLSDLGQGNFDDLLVDAEATAVALFTAYSGFTPEALGAVEDAGRSYGAMLLDLSSGNPEAAGRDVINLGLNVVKVLQSNVYFHAAATAIQNYANQIADDLIGAANFTADFYEHIVHGNLFTHPIARQDLIRDLSAVATSGFKDPRSISTYGSFYHANVIDGYISGATVFVDQDGDGVLDPGEYSTTTDAHGSYDLPAGIMGSIVTFGGTDTSTGLAFSYQLSAPNGSTAVTALTTLVQKIAAANGSNLIAANQQVAAAFGLDPSIALGLTDPIAAVRAGEAGGASLVLATTAVLNTLILLESAGATGDPTAVLAARIANAPFGTPIDLTNAATIADLASASGVSASAGTAVSLLASSSNKLLTNLINTAPDPTTLLNRATAVTVVAQGATATALTNAGNDPGLLASAVNQYTGTNLANTVQTTLGEVITQPAEPYYGPPRWYLDPTITGVVSTGSASGNSLSGSQSNQQMQTAFHDAAGSPSPASFTPTPDLLAGSIAGLVPSLDNLFRTP